MSGFADELRAEIAQLEQQLLADPRFVQLEKLRVWLAKYESEAAPKKKRGTAPWTPERRAAQSARVSALWSAKLAKPPSSPPPWMPSATMENGAATKDLLQETIAITSTNDKPRVGPPTPRPTPASKSAKAADTAPAVPSLKDRERDAISSFLEHRGATKLPPAHARGSVDEKLSPLG